MKNILITSLVMLFMAAGCTPTTHMNIDRSPVTLPGEFSQTGSRQVTQQWWLEFNDAPLNELIESAFEENFSLMAARERLLQARAVAKKAGADLSPSLGGVGSLDETWSRTDGSSDSSGSFLIGLQASYEIDLWGRLQSLEDAALLDARESREDLETAALTTAALIANTWYNLAESNARMDLLKKQQEINRLGLQLIQLRFNAGQVGIADILQQQQLIESKSGELARETATRKVLFNQLAILCGVAPELFQLPDQPALVELPPLPKAGVPASLLDNRPDIRSDYAALLAADRRVAAAIADRYPTLSISANLNSSGSSSNEIFSNWLANIGANLFAPIVDGGKRKAEVERVSSVARERLNSYSQTILTAVGEVEDALIQEKQQEKYIESLTVQLDLASRTLVNVRDRYKQGVEDYQRVLSALLSQQTLQLSLLSARQQLIEYRIDLYRALGGAIMLPEEHSTNTDQP